MTSPTVKAVDIKRSKVLTRFLGMNDLNHKLFSPVPSRSYFGFNSIVIMTASAISFIGLQVSMLFERIAL